jgi:hypothetical protein
MTPGATCVVNHRSWNELLLDSEASLRLVDTALTDLFLPTGTEAAVRARIGPELETASIWTLGASALYPTVAERLNRDRSAARLGTLRLSLLTGEAQ